MKSLIVIAFLLTAQLLVFSEAIFFGGASITSGGNTIASASGTQLIGAGLLAGVLGLLTLNILQNCNRPGGRRRRQARLFCKRSAADAWEVRHQIKFQPNHDPEPIP